MKIVLCSETENYENENFEIYCPRLFKGLRGAGKVPWGLLLKRTLEEAVDTKYVILYLDDFYLQSPVNNKRLEICLQYMEDHKDVANMTLSTVPPPYSSIKEYEWIVRRSKRAPYLFTLQAGLWRRDRLIAFLREHESPWHFEVWGSLRARRYKDIFVGLLRIDGKQPIFDYQHAIIRGLWQPFVGEFFKRESIDVDLSIRGVFNQQKQLDYRKRRDYIKSLWNVYRSLRP
jgi:hypothetical protein